MSDADRLQQIQNQFNAGLESRIAVLMAHVQDAQEINQKLEECEAEMVSRQAELEATEDLLEGLKANSEDYEDGLAYVGSLTQAIGDAVSVRGELLASFGKIAGQLHA